MSAPTGLVLPSVSGDVTPSGVVMIGPAGPFPASATWQVANQGMFVRFRVSRGRTVTGLRMFNGTAAADNWKTGIYISDGTTLTRMALSDATAQTGTSTSQDIPFTAPVAISTGVDYWAFLACDGTTGTILRNTFSGGTVALAMGTHGVVNTTYASPPATQAISGLVGSATGFAPLLAIY